MSKEDTRHKIVDAAIDLFWRKGYQATNMNELSDAAGVNKATVYQYFSSKEALALGAVQRMAERTRDEVFEPVFAGTTDPLERLHGIYSRVYEMHRAFFEGQGQCRGCPMVNIGLELAAASDEVRRAVHESFLSLAPYYLAILADLRENGRLPGAASAEQLAADLQANMNASLMASKLENRPEAILEGEQRALRFLAV